MCNRSCLFTTRKTWKFDIGRSGQQENSKFKMNRTVFGPSAAGRDDDNAEGGAYGGLEVAPPMEPSAVYTCVVESGPKICFATYDEESNNILLEECACDSTNFTDVVESYYSLVRPNLLLVGSNIVIIFV